MNSETVMSRYAVTYRQLDHWWSRGYLSPDGKVPEQSGTGHAREYPAESVQILEAMLALVAAGMRPEPASRVARDAGDARVLLRGALEVADHVNVRKHT